MGITSVTNLEVRSKSVTFIAQADQVSFLRKRPGNLDFHEFTLKNIVVSDPIFPNVEMQVSKPVKASKVASGQHVLVDPVKDVKVSQKLFISLEFITQ